MTSLPFPMGLDPRVETVEIDQDPPAKPNDGGRQTVARNDGAR